MIETSAGIQPGDSGGPLVNSTGRVIGVDTAASTTSSEPYAQAGSGSAATTATQAFAIPISRAVIIAAEIEGGQASAAVHIGATGFLGIEVQSAQYGWPGSTGATVADVEPGSPAATAGLQPGDVITSVAGTAITSAPDIEAALGAYHPGSTISIGWSDQFSQSHAATVSLAAGPAG